MQKIFDNFKKFVADQIPFHHANFFLQSISLETFVGLLIQKKPPNEKDPQKISEEILAKLDINPANFKPEVHAKFLLYIEYFVKSIFE